ncbi:hypothetical protein AZ468_18355 [Vibrio europaeus]|uniref:Uncharacterized protein n=1 Tax=Vibrio europaeus TaxID=300876 RepID=A0A178J7C6_9VIBR|nr:hypothetical protein AZ468_18355 [Vibrio europaeus]
MLLVSYLLPKPLLIGAYYIFIAEEERVISRPRVKPFISMFSVQLIDAIVISGAKAAVETKVYTFCLE